MTDSGTCGSAFDSTLEPLAIAVVRGLAMDAPHAARSGHQGTAMALAPLAHVLWTRILNCKLPIRMNSEKFLIEKSAEFLPSKKSGGVSGLYPDCFRRLKRIPNISLSKGMRKLIRNVMLLR